VHYTYFERAFSQSAFDTLVARFNSLGLLYTGRSQLLQEDPGVDCIGQKVDASLHSFTFRNHASHSGDGETIYPVVTVPLIAGLNSESQAACLATSKDLGHGKSTHIQMPISAKYVAEQANA
jgi:hypothetical protein